MNDLYIHQLETEIKQLREVLKSINLIVEEYLEIEKHCDELENKIDKANEILSKSCFEYDNCPDSVINEIIELKQILGGKE